MIVSQNHIKIKDAIQMSSYEIADRLEIIIPGFNKLKPIIKQDIRNQTFLTNEKIDENKVLSRTEEYKKLLQNNFITSENSQELAPCSWAVVCVVYFAVAVHNTAAVTTNVAVALAIWKWTAVTSSTLQDSQTSLQVERLINEIAIAQ